MRAALEMLRKEEKWHRFMRKMNYLNVSLLIVGLNFCFLSSNLLAFKSHDDEGVHQYIAKEAFDLWPGNDQDSGAYKEMILFLDNGNDIHDGYALSMMNGDECNNPCNAKGWSQGFAQADAFCF